MSIKNKRDILSFKIITLGESGVGKTSILLRFHSNQFKSNSESTTGLSFSYKNIILKNKEEIELKLIDTGGQEKYRALAKSYFKNSDGVFFVYAKDNLDSFKNIKEWVMLFNENHNGKEGIPQILVESKGDLKRIVDEKLSEDFAKENNMPIIKTSAKNNDSINELFEKMAELLYDNYMKFNNKDLEQKKINFGNKNIKKTNCCMVTNDLNNE